MPVWPGVGLNGGVLAKRLRSQLHQGGFEAAAGTQLWVAAQAFAQTLQQSRGFGSEFRFPDAPASATTPAGQPPRPAPRPASPMALLTTMMTSTAELSSAPKAPGWLCI